MIDRKELAGMLTEDRLKKKGMVTYLLNVNNPALNILYRHDRVADGNGRFAPGDVQRLEWELSMLTEEACQKIKIAVLQLTAKETENGRNKSM